MTSTPSTRSADRSGAQTRTGWVGWLRFAGIMLILVGAFQLIDGLIALFKDELYVVRPNGLVVNVDYTAWGWPHLLLGVLLIAAGYAVFSGKGLGPYPRRHRRAAQRDRELRVHPRLPGLVPAHHHRGRPSDLRADRARRRTAREPLLRRPTDPCKS
jgi:hypothetical protein